MASRGGGMDADFGNWYRAVSLNADHAQLSKRWSGVQRAVKEVKVEDALGLARAFSGILADDEWRGRFKRFFFDEDATFEGDNDSEIMVLAGACLCQLANDGSRIAEIGAQGVQTAAFGGTPDAGRLVGIRRRLSDFLKSRASEAREAQARPTAKDRTKRLETVFQPAAQGLPQAIEATKSALAELYAEVDDLRRRVSIAEKARAESSDVLWWLLSSYSLIAEKPFADVPAIAAPIVFAFDLATLTKTPIGFPNAAAFLSEALAYKRSSPPPETTALKSIAALDRAVRQRLVTGFDVQRLQGLAPVLHGLARSLEVPTDEIWSQVASTTEFDPIRRTCPSVALADQVYNELVLTHVARSA